MHVGESVVSASIWLAVVCYPAGPALRLSGSRPLRVAWTMGCLALLVHVVSAFEVHYGWSQTVALQETARRTVEVTGSAFGAGLYVNYVFVALWALDVAWSWWSPASHRARKAWVDLSLHAFLLFVVFNGAVVFVRGPLRWLGLVLTLAGLAALIAAHRGRRPRSPP